MFACAGAQQTTQAQTGGPMIPERIVLEMKVTEQDGGFRTLSIECNSSGAPGELKRDAVSAICTKEDRLALWKELQAVRFDEAKDEVLSVIYQPGQQPSAFPRNQLSLRIDGAVKLSFEHGADDQYLLKPLFDHLWFWLDERAPLAGR
jgi:hypothetical protein